MRYDLKNDMSLMSLMRFPDILSVEKAEADQDKIRAGLVALTHQALADYDQMRECEGAKLRTDVEEKLARIESLVTRVETVAPETAAYCPAAPDARERLSGRPQGGFPHSGVQP